MYKKTLILLLLLCSCIIIFADPAWPDSVLVHQPDGTNLWVYDRGDEFYNWTESTDGYPIVRNNGGIFEYASIESKQLKPSGVKVHNVQEKASVEASFAKRQLAAVRKNLKKANSNVKRIGAQHRSLGIPSSPVVGTRKVLTILAQFTDKPFTYNVTNFDSIMNTIGYTGHENAGSVRDYYYENSYGQLTIQSVVIGPFTAAHNSAYYSRPQGSTGDHAADLVLEAINWADAQGIDFNTLDGNNDGYVDCIHIIFAGNRYSSSGDGIIWPFHSAFVTPIVKDGTNISEFIMTPEKLGNDNSDINSIGTICHELGHVLGAPDFYGINAGSADKPYIGTGIWDVMGDGSHNLSGTHPAHHNPFTKTIVYQWTTPNTINASETNIVYSIPASSQNSTAIYKIPTSTTGEYYLIENRQKVSFDSSLADSGLLIYHISAGIEDAIAYNQINTSLPQKCYLVNPTSLQNSPTDIYSYGFPEQNVFPYKNYYGHTNIFFTSQTTPRSQSWAGEPTGVDVCFIQHDGNNMKFVVNPIIEGPDYICDTTCFSVKNVPEGATYSWTYTKPDQYFGNHTMHGQGTSAICLTLDSPPTPMSLSMGETYSSTGIIIPPQPIMPGAIEVVVSYGETSYTISKTIRKPKGSTPMVSVSDTAHVWPRGTNRTFSVTNCTHEPDSVFEWTVTRNAQIIPNAGTIGKTFTYRPTSTGVYTITVTNKQKECGDESTSKEFNVLRPFLQSPNMNNGTYTIEIWHPIYGLIRSQETHGIDSPADIEGLTSGAYIIIYKDYSGEVVSQTKIMINN